MKHLPGCHIYAADLRFHGASDAAGTPDWNVMADDIHSLIERVDLTRLLGVGHSIGGYLVVRAAARAPARFKHLVLIDPVILSAERYAQFRQISDRPWGNDHPVRRRKNRWRDALWQLACDPINEAGIYLNQKGNEVILEDLPAIATPVTLLRAPPGDKALPDLSTSPTWPGLAAALPNCREVYLPHLNHFIPMQDPALVAAYIQAAR